MPKTGMHVGVSLEVPRWIITYEPAVGLINEVLIYSQCAWQFSKNRRRGKVQEVFNKVFSHLM